MTTTIGIISDTHGLLRPEALEALKGSRVILHAGDVGRGDVLDPLREIAPVVAVRGNIDIEEPLAALPETAQIECGGRVLFMLHDIGQLALDPVAAGFAVVVAGHSHRPSITMRDGVLYVNPGSAGPRRFSLPVTLARLRLGLRTLEPEIIALDVPKRAPRRPSLRA